LTTPVPLTVTASQVDDCKAVIEEAADVDVSEWVGQLWEECLEGQLSVHCIDLENNVICGASWCDLEAPLALDFCTTMIVMCEEGTSGIVAYVGEDAPWESCFDPQAPEPCDYAEDVPGVCGNPAPSTDFCDYVGFVPGTCGNPALCSDDDCLVIPDDPHHVAGTCVYDAMEVVFGTDNSLVASVCAHVWGKLFREPEQACIDELEEPAPAGQFCVDNDVGGGGYSNRYDGRAGVADTIQNAINSPDGECTWTYDFSSYEQGCMIAPNAHYHYHDELVMAQDPYVGAFAAHLAVEGAEEFTATACVQMTYTETTHVAFVEHPCRR